jgi:hypothetical protein
MSIDLASNGVNLVRRMQVGEDMEQLWIMFDHVIQVDWKTMVCQVYKSRYCKVMSIAY